MLQIFAPADMLRLGTQVGLMTAEAQLVMTMRLWGMAGLWNVSRGENQKMIIEKPEAMRDAGLAASRAIASGSAPVQAAIAALKPLRKRTSANLRRLKKRGPKQAF